MDPIQAQSSPVIDTHKRKLLWLGLVVLLILIGGYAYYTKHKKPALDPSSIEARLEELNRLGETSSKEPITPEQQTQELDNLAKSSPGTTVTTEDQLNALNSLSGQ